MSSYFDVFTSKSTIVTRHFFCFAFLPYTLDPHISILFSVYSLVYYFNIIHFRIFYLWNTKFQFWWLQFAKTTLVWLHCNITFGFITTASPVTILKYIVFKINWLLSWWFNYQNIWINREKYPFQIKIIIGYSA